MRPFDPALLRALPETRGPVAVLSLVGALSGVVAIAQAVVLAVVIGRVVSGGPLGAVLAALVGLLALRGVLAALTEHAARRAGLRVAAAVRRATLLHWLGRPVEERPSDEVAVTRAGEGVAAVEPYVAKYLPALVTGVVVPVLAVGTLLLVDPWSALIVVLTLPLLPLFAALIGQHTAEQTERRWDAMALLAGHFLDVVRGLPTLVAYGRARAQVRVVRDVGERHREATVRTLRTAFMSSAALELLATISVAMVAVAVGLRLAYGQMDLVVGLAAILLAPEAYWPIRRVGAEFHSAADGAAVLEALSQEGLLEPQADRLTGVGVGAPSQAAAGGTGSQGAGRADSQGVAGSSSPLVLERVCYAHPGRERTIVDLSLGTSAGPGLTALVGPSGAGKTTVLELLAGLRSPHAGRVLAPRAHLASQRPVLLPGTVRDNLALVVRGSGQSGTSGEPGIGRQSGVSGQPGTAAGQLDATMLAALEQVGLREHLEDREGLDTVLGDDGFGLSAGQRARLALARALLSDAPLVLLDEPTANVSAGSVPALHEVIIGLARERRVVVVTHDPDLAALSDQVWHIDPPLTTPSAPPSHQVAAPTVSPVGTAPTVSPVGTAPTVSPVGTVQTVSPVGTVQTVSPVGTVQTVSPVGRGPGEVAPLPLPTGRRGLWAACLLGGASIGCGVALTATSGWLIVQASTRPVILTLMVAIVGVRAFGLFRPVLRYAERLVSHDVALRDLADRRADVFARLIPLTPARLGRRSRGEVLTAVVRDLDDVVDEQVRGLVPAWSALLATLVGVALAAWHLPAAGLVLAAGGALIATVGAVGYAGELAAQGAAVAHRGELQHRTTALVSRLLSVQSVTGLRADRATLLAPLATAEQAQQQAEQRLTGVRSRALLLTWLVVAATSAGVALLTWPALVVGELTRPVAALVALLPMALADTWVGVADIAGAMARSRAAGARLEEVLGQEPAVAGTGTADLPRSAPREGSPYLRLVGVGAAWVSTGGEATDLDLQAFDLELPPGSQVALTGPNGVGKSTALALLARHLDPLTGRYDVDGADALDLDLEQLRGRIALVDDEPHAFAGSVRANLVLAAPGADDADILAALETVDLGHWLRTLPQGLDTTVTGLSGGERARLSMARAVLSGRPVVLLDEPAAHLDDATAGLALGGLLTADPTRLRTHVMVSHRPEDLVGWDRVTVTRPDEAQGWTNDQDRPASSPDRRPSVAAT